MPPSALSRRPETGQCSIAPDGMWRLTTLPSIRDERSTWSISEVSGTARIREDRRIQSCNDPAHQHRHRYRASTPAPESGKVIRSPAFMRGGSPVRWEFRRQLVQPGMSCRPLTVT